MKHLLAHLLVLLFPLSSFAEDTLSTPTRNYRWCDPNSSKVTYSSGTVPGFVACPLPEQSKSKIQRSHGTPDPSKPSHMGSSLKDFKDFSKGVDSMTDAEKAQFATQIQQLQEKRARDFPADMMREMQKVMTALMTDDKFLREALAEAKNSPELKALMGSFGGKDGGLKRQIEQMLNDPDAITRALRDPQNDRMMKEFFKGLNNRFPSTGGTRDRRRFKP